MKRRRPQSAQRPRPLCESLDPRRLLSADPAGTANLSLLSATFDATHLDARYSYHGAIAPLSALVRNWDDADASFQLSVSLGLGTSPDPARDIPVGAVDLLTIPGGTVRAFNFDLILPADLRVPPGDYHIFVRADAAAPDVTPSDNVLLAGSPFLVRPDFWPAFTRSAPNFTVGSSRDVAVEVYDDGNALGYGFRTAVTVYLSTDPTLDAGDVPLGPVSVNVSGSAGPFTFTIPPTLPVGTYYPIAVVDPTGVVPELDKSNNATVGDPFTVLPPGDLVPTSLQLASPSAHPGQRITPTLSVTAANLPLGQSFVVRYVLTSDDVVGPGDVTLAQVTHVPFSGPPGFQDTLTIPADLPLGVYRLAVVLNPDHALAESDFANNTLLGPQVTVRPSAPDLVPSAPVIELAPEWSGWNPPTTEFTVSDLAQVPDGAIAYVSLYLSSDATLGPDDTLIASTWYWNTTGSPFVARFQNLPIPPALGTTWYPIAAVTLATDVDPSNNVTVGQPFTTPATRSVSIVSVDTDPTGPVVAGGSIPVNLTVAAAGYFPSDSFSVRYYLTKDATIDASDVPLGTQTCSVYTGPTDAPVPIALPPYWAGVPMTTAAGTYHVAAVVDGSGAAPVLASHDVTVIAPDLAATGGPTLAVISGLHPLFRPGDYVNFSTPVANNSDLSAWYIPFKVYLSTDPVLSDNDTPVYSDAYGRSLDPRSSTTWNGTFQLPASAGTYYPIVVLDPGQVTADADRSNNVAVGGPVTVTAPHFTLVSLSAPATVDNTGTFTVTGTALVYGFSQYDSSINFNLALTNGVTTINSSTLGPPPSALDTADSAMPVLVPFQFTFDANGALLRPSAYILSASPAYWGWPSDAFTVDVDPAFVAPTVTVTAGSTYFLSLSAPAYVGPVYYGQPATISFTVTNLGGQPSPATTVAITIAEQLARPWWYPVPTETLLDTIAIDPIPAGASRTITVTESMSGVSAIVNQLHFTADAAAFFEPNLSHEAYLYYSPTFHMPDPPNVDPPVYTPPIDYPWWPTTYADPTLFAVSSPASVTAGSALRVFTTPTPSAGISDYAVPFDVAYVLSANDTLGDADDIVLGTAHFTGTESAQARAAFAVPAGAAPGTYRLFAIIDPDNVIAESSEENNVLAGSTVTVAPPALAGSLSAANLRVGAAARLNLSLANLPGQPAARRKFTVSYYLSSDAVLSPDDTLFSKQTIDATLTSNGKSKSFPLTAKVPTTAPVGARHLIAVVDAATGPRAHLELASKPLTVLGPHLAPVVQLVAATARLDTSKVTVRLLNDGTAPSAAGPVTLRLLADGVPLLTTGRRPRHQGRQVPRLHFHRPPVRPVHVRRRRRIDVANRSRSTPKFSRINALEFCG